MTRAGQAHLDKHTGDIDFPLWAKVIAGLVSVSLPLLFAALSWLTVEVVTLRTELKYAVADKFTRTEFITYLNVQAERDAMQNKRLDLLEQE